MRTSISLIFILVVTICAYSQIPYHDATKLTKIPTGILEVGKIKKVEIQATDSAQLQQVANTLLPYFSDEIQQKIKAAETGDDLRRVIQLALVQNPFISLASTGRSNDGDKKTDTKVIGSLLSTAGSLNVTNLADGLAKFLVERAKQELSIAFFEKFKNTLDDQRQLQILFPTTFKNLSVIGNEIYQFSGYIEMLRQGFQKDIANLLPNVQTLINDDSMDAVFKKFPQLRTILSDGLYITIQLKNGEHIGDAFNSYVTIHAEHNKLDKVDPNLYPSLVLMNIFSQSIRSKEEDGKYWVTLNQVKELKDETTLKIYLGLIYQQIISFERSYLTDDKGTVDSLRIEGITLTKHFRTGANTAKYETFKKTILEGIIYPLVEKAKLVDEKFKSIKAYQISPEKEPTYMDYYELLDASLNFVEQVKITYQQVEKITNKDTRKTTPIKTLKVDAYLSSLRSLGNIYVDVNEKQYVSAISELTYLYNSLVIGYYEKREEYFISLDKTLDEKDLETIKRKMQTLENDYGIYFKENEKFYASAIKNLSSKEAIKNEVKAKKKQMLIGEDTLICHNKDITQFLIKYGNFIALVAKAENSDQVKDAIEAVALPAGSARIKRASQFNVALNAYLGGHFGNEYLEDQVVGKSKWSKIYGMSAPVGVTISKRLRIKQVECGSISLMMSLIDLGAVASFRTQNDSTANIPELTFQNILAPGAYVVWGIPKTPLSLGYGWQRGPQLREITTSTNGTENVIESSAYRWSIFFAVDIPLINFYTKTK